MERQAPFLKSVLREADNHKRQELLRMANADQINAISELVMNTIRGTVPRSRHTITLLKPHAQSLRAMAKPAHSVKRRRAIMMSQKGGTLWSELYRCYKQMVSTSVDNAPAFLQLRDKYKQELVEDTRLTKAADLAAKQHVLLASDVPDAWKRPQLKAVGRQLRHWTKKVRQPFGAPVSGVSATGTPATETGEDEFDAGPVQAWLTQLVKASQGIKQSASPAGPSRPGRKPRVPPKPIITPSAKKK
ncbi:unnamed protein product, partial [Porites lobata]